MLKFVKITLYMDPDFNKFFSRIDSFTPNQKRKKRLDNIASVINENLNRTRSIIFLCTHNSRRSQFCQIWSSTASYYYNIPVNCYSGGTEITECNKRVIKSIINNGFLVTGNDKNKNPEYLVAISANKTIKLFSKLFKKSINNDRTFIAVMTCSDADKNCPYIPGAEKRISLKYDDPKEFDNTALEIKKYEECSYKIATEIFYVFSEVSKKI